MSKMFLFYQALFSALAIANLQTGLRGLMTGEVQIFSARRTLWLMLAACAPLVLIGIMLLSNIPITTWAGNTAIVSIWIPFLIGTVMIIIFCYTMCGYTVTGVSEKTFRSALHDAMTKLNLPYIEGAYNLYIPSRKLNLQIRVQNKLGTTHIKFKQRGQDALLDEIAGALREVFFMRNTRGNKRSYVLNLFSGVLILAIFGFVGAPGYLNQIVNSVPGQSGTRRLQRAEREMQEARNELWLLDATADAGLAAVDAGELDKAKHYAAKASALNSIIKNETPDARVLHKTQLTYGRLALRAGDTESAKRYLLDSVRHDGAPTLNSFGPNMSLAKELLDAGERQIVLEYFDLCAKFWEMGRDDELPFWRAQVHCYMTPDFGANMIY